MAITDVLGEGGLQPGGSAAVEVFNGGGQVSSDVVVEWDLDNDGDFSEAAEDITPYVLAAETLTGRDWPSQLTGKASAGKLKATLDNSTDRFSKRNLASPLNAAPFSLKLGRKLRVRARIERALSVTGITNAHATTPNVAGVQILGDLVMGCEFDPAFLDGGGAQTLISKWDETSDERSAMLQIDTNGFPRTFTTPDGTSGAQRWITCAVRATSFARQCWWAAVDVDNGAGGMTVRFYWARRHTDTPILIDTQVSAGTTSIFNSTAPLKVAARGDGTNEPLGGDVYWAEWRAGDINSTDYRAAVNFAAQPTGTTSFADDEGLTWTVGAGASIIEDPNVDDPILLARDRFNRSAGSSVELGAAETGQVWQHGLVGSSDNRFIIFNNEARIAFPDVGFNVPDLVDLAPHRDCYVQARVGQPVGDGAAGVIARYVDPSNYLRVEFVLNQVTVRARVAGVDVGLMGSDAYYEIDWPAEGFILGLHVEQSIGRLYLNGVTGTSTLSYDLEPFIIPAALHAGTKAGIYGYWPNGDLEAPTVDDFYVWDRPTTVLPGVLWTGDLVDLQPTVDGQGAKIAQLEGDGMLARAAVPDVRAPVLPKEGEFTGVLVGEVLHKTQLLHPPGLLDLGTVRTGPIALPDGKAMTMLREFEDTEIGLLYETPEGPLGYQDRSARIGATTQAVFSDAPGAQFGYSSMALLDSRQEIINRVQAGVAADAPGTLTGGSVALTVDTNNAGAGVASHVDVQLPPVVSAGDLLVIFIASTVSLTGRGWKTPIWWAVHRQFGTDDDDSIRTRVFSHFCDGTEASTTVRFYQDTTTGGAWIAHIWRLTDWYESYDNGIAMADFTSGDNPTPFDHGWGRFPTAFFVARAGLTSVGGGSVNTGAIQNFPEGWNAHGTVTQLNGTVNGFDVALATSYRFDAQDKIDPGPFKGFQGYAINESVVFAVRGYNGPHTKATLANPQTTGGEGRVVTLEDETSQSEHNIIRSAPNVPALFRSEAEAEAYCEAVLSIYADDRPLPRISYFATRSGAYRAQAYRRRVGDAIHFTADGRTGMGIDSDHFIEAIGHKFTHGTRLWEVTYDLSPG